MLNGDEPKIQEILSSSAVKIENLGQIMLAISFKNEEDPDNPRTMILRYNAQDTGYFIIVWDNFNKVDYRTVIPTAYHADSSFIHNNHALTGFEREGFVYFVMTASQIFEPEVFLHDQSNNKVTVTKVIRFCATDQTADLASKISILVGCDQECKVWNTKTKFLLIKFQLEI